MWCCRIMKSLECIIPSYFQTTHIRLHTEPTGHLRLLQHPAAPADSQPRALPLVSNPESIRAEARQFLSHCLLVSWPVPSSALKSRGEGRPQGFTLECTAITDYSLREGGERGGECVKKEKGGQDGQKKAGMSH